MPIMNHLQKFLFQLVCFSVNGLIFFNVEKHQGHSKRSARCLLGMQMCRMWTKPVASLVKHLDEGNLTERDCYFPLEKMFLIFHICIFSNSTFSLNPRCGYTSSPWYPDFPVLHGILQSSHSVSQLHDHLFPVDFILPSASLTFRPTSPTACQPF